MTGHTSVIALCRLYWMRSNTCTDDYLEYWVAITCHTMYAVQQYHERVSLRLWRACCC